MAFVLVLAWGWLAWACDTCRPAVRAGIFNEHFWGRLALVLLPWTVMLLAIAWVLRLAARPRRPGRSAGVDLPSDEGADA